MTTPRTQHIDWLCEGQPSRLSGTHVAIGVQKGRAPPLQHRHIAEDKSVDSNVQLSIWTQLTLELPGSSTVPATSPPGTCSAQHLMRGMPKLLAVRVRTHAADTSPSRHHIRGNNIAADLWQLGRLCSQYFDLHRVHTCAVLLDEDL